MLKETVQLETKGCANYEERQVVGYNDGRPVFAGRLDTTPEGIVRMSELVTALVLQAECGDKP